MPRTLSQSEKSLWDRVASTISPLGMKTGANELAVRSQVAKAASHFNPVLDLHGQSVHDAHASAMGHLIAAQLDSRFKYVIIITGLSGRICEEFPRWFDNHPSVRSMKSLRGGGAWEIWLKKGT